MEEHCRVRGQDDASGCWWACCWYRVGLVCHRQCRPPRPEPHPWVGQLYRDIDHMQSEIAVLEDQMAATNRHVWAVLHPPPPPLGGAVAEATE